jgi:hypothetical protein
MKVTLRTPIIDDLDRASFFDELFEQWRREASESPPNIDDFAEMLVHIRANAALDRDIFSKSQPPDELTGGLRSLQAILIFLEKQRWLWEAGDLAPLLRLKGALDDLAAGNGSDLLKPSKKSGRPADGSRKDLIKAIAARTLQEFIEAGVDVEYAARRVAKALQARRREIGDNVDWKTIVEWRQRLMRKPGRGASKLAVQRFRAPLGNTFPKTPKERGEALLKAPRGAPLGRPM